MSELAKNLAAAREEHIPELDYVIPLDLETAGLNPEQHEILEVAAVVGRFDADGNFVRFGGLSRVMPLRSDITTWHDEVIKMHSANGLLAECASVRRQVTQAYSPHAQSDEGKLNEHRRRLDDELARLASNHPKDRKYTLVGNTVHFDLNFVKKYFPNFAAHLSHRVLDVSSVRLFLEMLGKPYVKGDVAHRAMADVEMSLATLASYRDWVRAYCSDAARQLRAD